MAYNAQNKNKRIKLRTDCYEDLWIVFQFIIIAFIFNLCPHSLTHTQSGHHLEPRTQPLKPAIETLNGKSNRRRKLKTKALLQGIHYFESGIEKRKLIEMSNRK